jgi:metallophosphoesterase (TIGR00282 family)
MHVNIAVVGDIVGAPGRKIIAQKLPALRRQRRLDFVIANGENAAGGVGLTPATSEELFDAGVDCLTSGDHIWKHREIIPYIEEQERLLRPANYPASAPGRGLGIYKTAQGTNVAVVNLLGRVFLQPIDSPFDAARTAVDEAKGKTNVIIVDLHAEATSEKVAMGWFLDGKVSAVVGSHTHIQTADERVLPGGSAYITDVGMTGPYDSVLGRNKERVVKAVTTLMPISFTVAKNDVKLCGVFLEIDVDSGKAVSIERFQIGEDQ